MTNHDAILLRKSRRKYRDLLLSNEEREIIEKAITKGNKLGNLSMKLIENRSDLFGGFFRSYGLLSGVSHFIVMAGPKNDPHLFEKLGYYGEEVVIEATKLGLGTCWVGGSFNKKAVSDELVQEQDLLACVIVIGHPLLQPTMREQIIRSIMHLKKEDQAKFYQTDGSHPDWFMQAMDYVYHAPSAVNQQPVWMLVIQGKVMAKLRTINHYAWIDLGIAKRHFEYGAPKGRFDLGNNALFHEDH